MLLPIWDAAMAEIADGHALVGAYGPLAPLMGTSLPMAPCSGKIAIMKMNLITEKLAYAFTLINLILGVQIT